MDYTAPSIAPTHIHWVRHGHVYNPDQIIYGRLPDFRLSELGREQIRQTANYLRTLNIDALYVSPMLRAQETADIISGQVPSVPRQTSDAINEVAFYYEGAPMNEMESRNWDLYTGVPDDYEQPADVVRRVTAFIQELLLLHQGQSVALVSHGDVIAFTTLWAFGVELLPSKKHTLNEHALADSYPALASITTLTFMRPDINTTPRVTYTRPYGEELVDTNTSPK